MTDLAPALADAIFWQRVAIALTMLNMIMAGAILVMMLRIRRNIRLQADAMEEFKRNVDRMASQPSSVVGVLRVEEADREPVRLQ
jgi:hypothetical protein